MDLRETGLKPLNGFRLKAGLRREGSSAQTSPSEYPASPRLRRTGEDDDDSEEKPLVAAGRLRWVLCGCPFHLYDLRVQPIRVNSRLFAVRILQPT